MGATSVTGVGQGSASKVGPAIKNITINDPHIIISGENDERRFMYMVVKNGMNVRS